MNHRQPRTRSSLSFFQTITTNHNCQTMRIFLITFLLSTLSFLLPAQTGIPSKVTDVTIFKGGAQISRSADTRLNAGLNLLIIKDVSPFLQANTLRVTLEGNATVLSVQYSVSVPDDKTREADIKKNEQYIVQKNEDIILLRNQLKIVNQEESMLQKNQVQVIGLTNYSLKPAELEELIAMQNRRNTAVTTQQYNLGKAITAKETERDSLKRVIENLRVITQKPMGEIVLSVKAAQTGSFKIQLNYFVPQSSWSPLYDVRVKDISQPVNLVQRATLFQQTGEEWNNVKMHLSTGDPNVNNVSPVLTPWRIGYHNPYSRAARPSVGKSRYSISGRGAATEIRGKIIDAETGEDLIGVNVTATGTNAGTISNIDGTFMLQIPPAATGISFSYIGYSELFIPIKEARGSIVNVMLNTNSMALSEVEVTAFKVPLVKKEESEKDEAEDIIDDAPAQATVTALPTTLLYDIEEPVTLAPDGKPLVLDINTYELPATFQHYCVPKLDPQVYLMAKITGWDTLGLQSGTTSLFFEGTYLGKSYLEFITTSDTLVMSLGRDQNVVATRTKMREFSKRRFLSDQKEDSRSFDLVFKNKKSQPIQLLVADQIPVSTRKSIEVKSTEISGATLDKNTGILEWKIDIKPGGTEKRKMGYTVRYPKSRVVVLE